MSQGATSNDQYTRYRIMHSGQIHSKLRTHQEVPVQLRKTPKGFQIPFGNKFITVLLYQREAPTIP